MEPKKKKTAALRGRGRPKAKTPKAPAKKNDPDIQNLAARIRALRKKAGHSNADYFAYAHDITRAQYGRYELGEDIRFSSLMKLIKAFGLTPAEFFAEGFD